MAKKQKTNQSNKIPRFEDLNFDQMVYMMEEVEREGFNPEKETYDQRINQRIDKKLKEEGGELPTHQRGVLTSETHNK